MPLSEPFPPTKRKAPRLLKTLQQAEVLHDIYIALSSALKERSCIFFLVNIVRTLANALQDTHFEMRSFDDRLHEHLPSTNNTESAVSFIRSLHSHDGDADFMVPIDEAERVFTTSHKDERSRRKALIIVSDGQTKNSDCVAKRCAEMRAKGTLIVMLGVGANMSRKALRTFASPGCDFFLDHFNSLTNEMAQLVHKIQDEHEQMLRVEFSFDTMVDLGCNCILEAGATVTVQIKLRAKDGAQDELQSMHWLSKSCELSFHTYALKNPQNPHDRKEWTLVSSGSGKSTLITSFFRWALEQEKLCVCESGYGPRTVTNEIQHLQLSKFCGESVWLKFIDTWSIDVQDHGHLKIPFTDLLLRKLLRGQVPPGFRPRGDLEQSLEDCKQMSSDDLPHCVIFVVDPATNGDPKTTKRLAELTKIVDELHRDYIILVTNCSIIVPSLSGSDMFDSQCKRLNNAKDQTANCMLDHNRIIFTENIGFEGDTHEKRIFCRDLALFRVLLRLFENHRSK